MRYPRQNESRTRLYGICELIVNCPRSLSSVGVTTIGAAVMCSLARLFMVSLLMLWFAGSIGCGPGDEAKMDKPGSARQNDKPAVTRMIHFAAFTIALGDAIVEQDKGASTYHVTVPVTLTNDGSLNPASLSNEITFLIGGIKQSIVATVSVRDIAPGTSMSGSLIFTGFITSPDLTHAVIIFGTESEQNAVVPAIGEARIALMPVPVTISGTADTGEDTTAAAFESGVLRADGTDIYDNQEMPKSKLCLVLRYKVTIGTRYTNGATEYWSSKHLVLHAPNGKVIIAENLDYMGDSPGKNHEVYYILDDKDIAGEYQVINTYVGCCGTKQGKVTFTLPAFN